MALRELGARVEAVEGDLATKDGVESFYSATRWGDRPIEIFCANAGRGLGKAFLDQDIEEAQRVVATNVSGTIRRCI